MSLHTIVAVLLGVFVLSQANMVQTAYAATPPDSCFLFSSGTVTSYYDNEANNIANPACPKDVDIPSTIGGQPVVNVGDFAFNARQLTSITLPPTIMSIGDFAFSGNQLTSITLPPTVSTIGQYAFSENQIASLVFPSSIPVIPEGAFSDNQLTSLTLPSSVTSIGPGAFFFNRLVDLSVGTGPLAILSYAFSYNRLTRVTIPSTVTSIAPDAFTLQVDDPAAYLYAIFVTPDPAVVAAQYSTLRYVQLSIVDLANPSGLTDGAVADGSNDYNGDSNPAPVSIGGHLINPASAMLRFTDISGSAISAPLSYTGRLQNMAYLTSYLVAEGPALPGVVDRLNMTPEELQAVADVLAAYYRIGTSVSFAGPILNGIQPSPVQYNFVLGASVDSNTRTYIYSAIDTAAPQLAATGGNSAVIYMCAFGLIAASVVLPIVRRAIGPTGSRQGEPREISLL